MTDLRTLTTRHAPDTDRADDWRDSAACVGSEYLFDHVVDWPSDEDAEARALAICASCPVMEQCRAEVGDIVEYGVVGGLTAKERRAIRRGRPVRTIKRELKHRCPACDRTMATAAGITLHWSHIHAPVVGKCIRGHDYNGKGACLACRDRPRWDRVRGEAS